MGSRRGPVLRVDLEKRLRQHSLVRKYQKQDLVCAADSVEDFFFIVTEGSLRVFFTHIGGREFSLSMLESGSLFTSHTGLNIAAVTDSTLEVVDANLVRAIMVEEPEFALYLMRVVGEMLGTSLHCIESLVFENLECRLADYLLQQAVSDVSEPVPTKHKLSVEEIAKFVGSSRQSVSMLLGNWQRDGVVSHRHKCIYIDDIGKLRQIANRPLSS